MLSDSLRTNVKACNYYDIFKLNTTLNNSSHFYIHLNILSLQSHFDKLYDLLLQLTHPPSIIFISETRINKEPLISINLLGYTFLHSSSPTVVDGIGAYFSNQLTFAINNLLQLHVQGCEDLWFNVSFPNSKLHYIFAVIYRHPHNNHTPFFNALDETFQILNRKESKVIIVGDININMLSDPNFPHLNHYNQILISNGFTSCITNPTRITKLSQTSIDHLITNVNGTIITSGLLQYSISDHLPIFRIASSVKHKNPFKNSTHYYRNIKNLNGDDFWDDLYDNLTPIIQTF